MALRGTLTHRKTRRLAKMLDISPCYALGILEALWHVTAEQAPSGDIGRLSNEDIAEEMFFAGDPAQLIDALVFAGFLDQDDQHRLLVHDWAQHADFNTKRKLARHGRPIFTRGGEEWPVANPDASQLFNDRAKRATPLLPEPAPEPEPEIRQSRPATQDATGVNNVSEEAEVRQVFEFYVKECGRSKAYLLTPRRLLKGSARLRELRKIYGNNAVTALGNAVSALAASDYHMGRDSKTNGVSYCDWIDNLMKSQEQVNKWLEQYFEDHPERFDEWTSSPKLPLLTAEVHQ